MIKSLQMNCARYVLAARDTNWSSSFMYKLHWRVSSTPDDKLLNNKNNNIDWLIDWIKVLHPIWRVLGKQQEAMQMQRNRMTCHKYEASHLIALVIGTTYDQSAHQIWSLYINPLWRYNRQHKMWKLGWFEWLEVIGNQIIWYSVHDFLFNFNGNMHLSYTIFKLQWVIYQKSAKLTYTTCICSSLWGWPRSNFAEIFRNRKLNSLGYHVAWFALS